MWGDILSPVFDSAGTALIVDVEGGKVMAARTEALGPQMPYSRASRLSEWGVQVLICGAISMEFARMLDSFGIEVIGFISGNARQVLDAYLEGTLIQSAYAMPGCQRGPGRGAGPRRRRFRGGRG
jgi:predicted Fe-Mo cluster-binding NifX family protein